MGGVLFRLYGEYFSDEASPFQKTGSNITLTQNVQQEQTQFVSVNTFLKQIDEKIASLSDEEEDKKKKDFLKSLKSSLEGVRDLNQIVATVAKIASEWGLSWDDVMGIFS